MHIPRQKQHTSLSENLWMEKWFNTLGGPAGLPTLLSKRTGDTVGLSVCPLVCLGFSICQFAHQWDFYISFISLFDCLFAVCLTSGCFWPFSCVYLSVWTSTSRSAWFCFSLTICLHVCLFTSLSVRLPDSLLYICVCHSICLSIYCIYWTVCQSCSKEGDRQLGYIFSNGSFYPSITTSRLSTAFMVCIKFKVTLNSFKVKENNIHLDKNTLTTEGRWGVFKIKVLLKMLRKWSWKKREA